MNNKELATFGGGCFWCVEAVLQRLKGVEKIVSGYAGGEIENPTYRQISTGTTGHAEVVQVTYDPAVISFEDLLIVFMTTHDPTTVDQQGADRGPQYRSIVLYHDEGQKKVTEQVMTNLKDTFGAPIVTQVEPLEIFYPGEVYHQNYYNTNRTAGYCRVVIDPKVSKLRSLYADKLKME